MTKEFDDSLDSSNPCLNSDSPNAWRNLDKLQKMEAAIRGTNLLTLSVSGYMPAVVEYIKEAYGPDKNDAQLAVAYYSEAIAATLVRSFYEQWGFKTPLDTMLEAFEQIHCVPKEASNED